MACGRRSSIPSDLLNEGIFNDADKSAYVKWKLSCVRCHVVVNPQYYLICKEKGHFLCGQCAWLKEPRPLDFLCCSPENLRKGSAGWLEDILDKSMWHCLYKKNGCEETPSGVDWEGHVQTCHFNFALNCFVKNCEAISHGVEDTIKHYKEDHMLMERVMEGFKIKLDLMYDRSEDGVKRRLIVLKDNDSSKYYILGSEVTEGDFNIFIWDCSRKENYKEGESGQRYELGLRPSPGNKANTVGHFTYTGMCQPMEKMPEDVIENADCFSIGFSRLMKKYLRPFPACTDLDLCTITINLGVKKESPKPKPQLPTARVDDALNRQKEAYAKSFFPILSPHPRRY